MRLLSFLLWVATATAAQTVDGSVTDSLTGTGIPGASVALDKDGKTAYRASTDPMGKFQFDSVADGAYRAVISAPGYVAPEMTRAVTHDLRVAGSSVKFDASLVPAAKISGKVLDPDDHPVSGAEVELNVAGSFVGDTRTTGADGTFQFPRVSPGAYILSARAPAGLKPPPGPSPSSPGTDEAFGWTRTFYPNATDKTSAAKIVVQGGWQLAGQDIHLRPVALHRVRGTVVGEHNQPVAHVQIAFDLNGEIAPRTASAVSSADGSFVSPSLHDGGWRVSAVSESAGRKLKAFRWLDLSGRDFDRQDLRLSEAFAIHGTVDVPSASGGNPAGLMEHPGGCVMLSPEEGGSGDDIGQSCEGAREFTIGNIYPRKYVIYPIVFPEGDYYLASIAQGERDIMGQTLDLQPGSLPLHIIYKKNGGTLRGAVADCAGASVVVMPQEAALRKSVYYRTIRRASCDEGGRFQIANLRPGLYYAFAFDRDRAIPNEFAVLDQALVNQAVTAHIHEGEIETVDLRVTARQP